MGLAPPNDDASADTCHRWSYDVAFSRNLGLISPDEQQRLRNSRVAIAGMGGIGGSDLITLVRMGVGRFTIADPDCFEQANVNRQYGSRCSTFGRNKAEVMAEIARDINPEVDIRLLTEPICADNATDFLHDADVFVDAIEVFEMDVRRQLFRQAALQRIFSITAGPVGFSGIWIIFDPLGMSFDRYFDLSDDMDETDKVVAFVVGVAPKATHRKYLDLRYVDIKARRGPSSAAACQIASGAMACQVVKILLGRSQVKAAPYYQQFDPYANRFAKGFLWRGNRHPWQRIKRRILTRKLRTTLK